jgi:tRNA(fMet)-specific endonuclease VapC
VALTRVCLDTSAYSQFKRGHAAAVAAVSGARMVLVPAVVLGELRAGFLAGRRPDENEAELREFLSHPAVRVLDVDDDAATVYAQIFTDLREAGTPIPTNDVWVAALAAREGATVLTFDDHFRCVRRADAVVLSRP